MATRKRKAAKKAKTTVEATVTDGTNVCIAYGQKLGDGDFGSGSVFVSITLPTSMGDLDGAIALCREKVTETFEKELEDLNMRAEKSSKSDLEDEEDEDEEDEDDDKEDEDEDEDEDEEDEDDEDDDKEEDEDEDEDDDEEDEDDEDDKEDDDEDEDEEAPSPYKEKELKTFSEDNLKEIVDHWELTVKLKKKANAATKKKAYIKAILAAQDA